MPHKSKQALHPCLCPPKVDQSHSDMCPYNLRVLPWELVRRGTCCNVPRGAVQSNSDSVYGVCLASLIPTAAWNPTCNHQSRNMNKQYHHIIICCLQLPTDSKITAAEGTPSLHNFTSFRNIEKAAKTTLLEANVLHANSTVSKCRSLSYVTVHMFTHLRVCPCALRFTDMLAKCLRW